MANTDDTMENIVERMGSLPIVNTTVHQVSTLYSNTKERWWVARCTLGLAERSLQMAAWTAKPVAERMGMDVDGTVAMANQYACRGLDVLEEKVPLLKKQPGQIVEETKKAVDSKVQAGSKRLLQTSLGQVIWWTTDTALDITERCVEYYLPNRKKDDEKEVEQVPKAAETEKSLLVRATTLTDKVHSRLSEGASIRMKSVQRCGRELLDTLRDMLELIERAKGEVNMEVQGDLMLVSKPVCQEPDKDEDTQSLERQSLQVVASLLQEVGSICSLMVLQVWALPQHLQDNITQAKAMADQLYDSFCKIPDVCLVDLENIDFGFDEILEDLELNDGGGGGGVYVPYFHPRRPIHGA